MAFDKNFLSLMEHANGFARYRYDTEDAHAVVDSAGYFTGAETLNMLKVGDIIDVVVWATAIRTGTVSTYGKHIVLSNDGTTIDVSDVTVGVVTDTD